MNPFHYKIEQRFHDYNARYFEGKIACTELTFRKLKHCAGYCRIRYTPAAPERDGIPSRPAQLSEKPIQIVLDSSINRTGQQLDGILLHEMVHAYLFSAGHFKHGHGPLFREVADRVQRLSGVTIEETEAITRLCYHPSPPRNLGLLCWERPGTIAKFAICEAHLVRSVERFQGNWKQFSGGVGKLHSYEVRCPELTLAAKQLIVHRPRRLLTPSGKPTVTFIHGTAQMFHSLSKAFHKFTIE